MPVGSCMALAGSCKRMGLCIHHSCPCVRADALPSSLLPEGYFATYGTLADTRLALPGKP